MSSVSFLVVRVSRSRRISGDSVENNIQSWTKQLCGFHGSASLILLPPTLRRAVPGASTALLLSWPGNGRRVVETAQGTLIGALPNYHVGSELALRLLDSRGVRKSREDQYHSVVVIKSPTLRTAFKVQDIYPNVRIHIQRSLGMHHVCRNEIRALEIELDIYRFGKCGRCGMLSESQIEVLPRISRSFVLGGARLSLR